LEVPTSFGDWLRRRRKTLDLTREDLANLASCSVSALRKLETGERRPSKQLAALLAASLQIPPDEHKNFIHMARGELLADRFTFTAPESGRDREPQRATTASSTRLPIPPLPLVGREPELASLEQLLQNPACRLLTLVGSGGIGKTRLAIEVAHRHQVIFPSGVCFISLASLSSPSFLITTLSDALGLSFSNPMDQQEQLLSFLVSQAGQPFLLVMDNLEHLLDQPGNEGLIAGADMFILELIQRVTNLKIMVTSRTRVNVQGEWIFELKGLPVPTVGQFTGIEGSSAVKLFLQRTMQVKPDFVFTPEEKKAVVEICQMVEGSPLAIELAAAWTRILTCREIAREIESNLDILETSMRHIPERHRSMRATFDHSWKLLLNEERRLLRQLSVFQGGFLREAAEQVAGATLPSLASLVSQSLLNRKENGRFDFHVLIRQYALSHFASDADNETVKDRHSDFYLRLLRDHGVALRGTAQQTVIRELTDEIDNVRIAITWAIKREKILLLGQALHCFTWFCDIRGWLSEGIEQCEFVVKALHAGSESEERRITLGIALGGQGMLYFRQGQYDRALTLLKESLDLLRPIGDPALLPDKLIIYGVIMFLCGRIASARMSIDEGLACAQTVGDSWHEALGLLNRGIMYDMSGQYLEAYDQMYAGLNMWRTLGDQRMVALALNFLSPTTIRLERYEEAHALLQESLALTTQLGDRWGMGTAYRCLGMVALAQSNASLAESLILKSIALFTELGARWDIARALTTLGEVKLSAQDLSEARQTFMDALRLATERKTFPLILDALIGLAQLQAQTGENDQALEICIYVLSHSASTYEAKERARRLRTKVETHLSDQEIESAIQCSANQTLEHILEKYISEDW
jgi:predicted ATPase/DNA-binding XRE family transcriptional regulator